jgi:hypothetical protein
VESRRLGIRVAIDHSLRDTWPALPMADVLDVGFHEDASAAGTQNWWDEVLSRCAWHRQTKVIEDGGTVGQIQYFVRRSRLGFAWGRNPDWSISRPLSLHSGLTPQHRIAVLETLVQQLTPRTSFYLVFREHAAWMQDAIDVFTRNGFEHSRGATYRWGPNDGDVLDLMKSKARSQLKRAQKQLEVTEINSETFLSYYSRNLARENKRPARPLPLAKALLDRACAHGVVRITAARRLSGSADYDAAIACTWDEGGYYYWMSSHRPIGSRPSCDKPHKDAVKVLILDAMAHARSLGLTFDTDGTGSAGGDHLYGNILKLKRADIRHTFRRMSRLAACYERYKPLLLDMAGRVRLMAAPRQPG